MTKKIPKNFRFNPSTVATLDELVNYFQKIDTMGRKVTATDVIEFLIKEKLDSLTKR